MDQRTIQQYSKDDITKIRKSSEQFEAIFIEIMLKSMRASIQKSGFIDGGNGEDVFRGMLDFEHAKTMASQRNSGLSNAIEKQLLGVSQDVDSLISKVRGSKIYGKTFE